MSLLRAPNRGPRSLEILVPISAIVATIAAIVALACGPKAVQEAQAKPVAAEPPKVTNAEEFRTVEKQWPLTARRMLRQLLDRRIAAEARGENPEIEAVDLEIRSAFEKKLAVMVTDMSGFTAKTKQLGIIGFLAEVRRLFHLAEPIVWKHKAQWVKVDADDLFVTHEDPKVMFDLAHELLAGVTAHNETSKEHSMGLSIGLGFGPTLVVEHDVWGDSVNTASKLGEDVGKAGEILISEDFYGALDKDRAALCAPVSDFAARGSKFPFYACR